jgi:hypothetical protein
MLALRMRPFGGASALLLFVILSTAIVADRATPCTCSPPLAVPDALRESQAVFVGVILKQEIVRGRNYAGGPEIERYVARVRVARSWKGVRRGMDVYVRTNTTRAACGYPFKVGRRFLIYGGGWRPYEAGDTLRVGACDRTVIITGAQADVDALGKSLDKHESDDIPPKLRKVRVCATPDAGAAHDLGRVEVNLPLIPPAS